MNLFVDRSQLNATGLDYLNNVLNNNEFLSLTGNITGNLEINSETLPLYIIGEAVGGSGIYIDSIQKRIGIGIEQPSASLHIFDKDNCSIYIDPSYPNKSRSYLKLNSQTMAAILARETGGFLRINLFASESEFENESIAYNDTSISFIDKNNDKYMSSDIEYINFNSFILSGGSKIEFLYKAQDYIDNKFSYISGTGFSHYMILDTVNLEESVGSYYDLYLYENQDDYVGNFQININRTTSDIYNKNDKYPMSGFVNFYFSGKDYYGNNWTGNFSGQKYTLCTIPAGLFIASGFAEEDGFGNTINPNQEFIPFGSFNNKTEYYSKYDTGEYRIKWDSSKWIFTHENEEKILYINKNNTDVPLEYGWATGVSGECPIGCLIYLSSKIENKKSLIYDVVLSGIDKKNEYVHSKKYSLPKIQTKTFYSTGDSNFLIKFDPQIDSFYTGNFTLYIKNIPSIEDKENSEIFIKTKNENINNSNKHTNWMIDYSGGSPNSVRYCYNNIYGSGIRFIENIGNCIEKNNQSGIDGYVYLLETNYDKLTNDNSDFISQTYSTFLNSENNKFFSGNFLNQFPETGESFPYFQFSDSTEIYQNKNSIYEFGLVDRILTNEEKTGVLQKSRLQDAVKSGIKFLFKINNNSNIVYDTINGYTGIIQNYNQGRWL